ncbi:hypothetical protein DPMN_030189 [Dreissena polymorpha]|uniref:Uncharacterized protein n=1 Tax=Dreissena polymorpha TaxID=45954 RepID=A0A9D4LZZ2_DREPO|nr:hypothetical protein DPMN_030189 [Dreissena polymorpha]
MASCDMDGSHDNPLQLSDSESESMLMATDWSAQSTLKKVLRGLANNCQINEPEKDKSSLLNFERPKANTRDNVTEVSDTKLYIDVDGKTSRDIVAIDVTSPKKKKKRKRQKPLILCNTNFKPQVIMPDDPLITGVQIDKSQDVGVKSMQGTNNNKQESRKNSIKPGALGSKLSGETTRPTTDRGRPRLPLMKLHSPRSRILSSKVSAKKPVMQEIEYGFKKLKIGEVEVAKQKEGEINENKEEKKEEQEEEEEEEEEEDNEDIYRHFKTIEEVNPIVVTLLFDKLCFTAFTLCLTILSRI